MAQDWIMYLVEEKYDLQNTEPKAAGNGFSQMWDMKTVCSPHLLVNILSGPHLKVLCVCLQIHHLYSFIVEIAT